MILETLGPSVNVPQTVLLPIALGAAGGGVLLMVLVVGVVGFLCVLSRKIGSHTTHLKTPVPLTITINTGKNKIFASTPEEGSYAPKEFLRDNIDFHEQIGKGQERLEVDVRGKSNNNSRKSWLNSCGYWCGDEWAEAQLCLSSLTFDFTMDCYSF